MTPNIVHQAILAQHIDVAHDEMNAVLALLGPDTAPLARSILAKIKRLRNRLELEMALRHGDTLAKTIYSKPEAAA